MHAIIIRFITAAEKCKHFHFIILIFFSLKMIIYQEFSENSCAIKNKLRKYYYYSFFAMTWPTSLEYEERASHKMLQEIFFEG